MHRALTYWQRLQASPLAFYKRERETEGYREKQMRAVGGGVRKCSSCVTVEKGMNESVSPDLYLASCMSNTTRDIKKVFGEYRNVFFLL